MGKFFGTDDFRSEARITIIADYAYKVGRFLGGLSIAILVYMIGFKFNNGVMGFLSKIAYEWYLMHLLIHTLLPSIFYNSIIKYAVADLTFIGGIVVASLYKRLID